jgi:hypothetical protein
MDVRKQEAVMAMSAEERFAYFVRKVADLERVWGLHAEGWATAANAGGAIALALWPEPDFAAACATGAWEAHVPKAIPLGDFLTVWLPGMVRDARAVVVFPTGRDAGLFVGPEVLQEAIHREMWQCADG